LAVYEESGNRRGQAESQNQVGLIQWEQGDLALARKTFEEALAIARETGDEPQAAKILGNLATVANDAGDLNAAEKEHEEAISMAREVGDKATLINEQNNLASVLFEQGELAEAFRLQDEAIPLAHEVHLQDKEAFLLSANGEVLTEMGNIQKARERHKAALAIWTDIGRRLEAAYDAMCLARLDAEEGRGSDAEIGLRQAIDVFRGAKDPDNELRASTYLADTLLWEGKVSEAHQISIEMAKLLTKSQNKIYALDARITTLRIAASEGKWTSAVQQLESIVKRAHESGYVVPELKARLAIGLIQRDNKSSLWQIELDKVAADAAARGFHLIEKQAQAGEHDVARHSRA